MIAANIFEYQTMEYILYDEYSLKLMRSSILKENDEIHWRSQNFKVNVK